MVADRHAAGRVVGDQPLPAPERAQARSRRQRQRQRQLGPLPRAAPRRGEPELPQRRAPVRLAERAGALSPPAHRVLGGDDPIARP